MSHTVIPNIPIIDLTKSFRIKTHSALEDVRLKIGKLRERFGFYNVPDVYSDLLNFVNSKTIRDETELTKSLNEFYIRYCNALKKLELFEKEQKKKKNQIDDLNSKARDRNKLREVQEQELQELKEAKKKYEELMERMKIEEEKRQREIERRKIEEKRRLYLQEITTLSNLLAFEGITYTNRDLEEKSIEELQKIQIEVRDRLKQVVNGKLKRAMELSVLIGGALKEEFEEAVLEMDKIFRDRTSLEQAYNTCRKVLPRLEESYTRYRKLKENVQVIKSIVEEMSGEFYESGKKLIKNADQILNTVTSQNLSEADEKISQIMDEAAKLKVSFIEFENRKFKERSDKFISEIQDLMEKSSVVLRNSLNSFLKEAQEIVDSQESLEKKNQLLNNLTTRFRNLKEKIENYLNHVIDTNLNEEDIAREVRKTVKEIAEERVSNSLKKLDDLLIKIQDLDEEVYLRFYEEKKKNEGNNAALVALSLALEAEYVTLKAKVEETDFLKRVIQGILLLNSEYPAVVQIAEKILQKRYINDQDFKSFVEEVANITSQNIITTQLLTSLEQVFDLLRQRNILIINDNGEVIDPKDFYQPSWGFDIKKGELLYQVIPDFTQNKVEVLSVIPTDATTEEVKNAEASCSEAGKVLYDPEKRSVKPKKGYFLKISREEKKKIEQHFKEKTMQQEKYF